MKSKHTYRYRIYLNDTPTLDYIPATKRAAIQWVRNNVRSTHMGEWAKSGVDRYYSTTIGRYYKFQRINMTTKIGEYQ